jgi:hypothetical protein
VTLTIKRGALLPTCFIILQGFPEQKTFKRSKKFKKELYDKRKKENIENPERKNSVLFRTRFDKWKTSIMETGLEALEAEYNLLKVFKKNIRKRKIQKKVSKPTTAPKFNSKTSKKARNRIKKFKKDRLQKKLEKIKEKKRKIKEKYAIK